MTYGDCQKKNPRNVVKKDIPMNRKIPVKLSIINYFILFVPIFIFLFYYGAGRIQVSL